MLLFIEFAVVFGLGAAIGSLATKHPSNADMMALLIERRVAEKVAEDSKRRARAAEIEIEAEIDSAAERKL